MNTLKNIAKRAVAAGSGVLMLGATLMGATAAESLDLAKYPAPFVKNGQFDALLVVGADAKTADVIGAIDIASSIQAASTTVVSTSGGASTPMLEGDNARIGDSSDVLEVGEFLGDVTESLTGQDLEMLKSGSITTDKSTTDYTQTLNLDVTAAASSNRVVLDENEDDETGVYLLFENGEPVYTYELEFTSGLESDIQDEALDDLEDENIFMLGKFYSVVDSAVETTGADGMTLELIAGDTSDTLSEGATGTYNVAGVDYEVTVLVIGDKSGVTTVKFIVNGETTDAMEDGDTDTLSDGLEIGVRDIIETTAYRESDPSSLVEFYLGANKLEIVDADITTDDGAATVEINRESIDDLDADISGTITGIADGDDARINQISMTLNVDAKSGSDVYLSKGQGLRDQLDEPEGMIGDIDLVYQGLSDPGYSAIKFNPNGDDEYTVEFTNRRGDTFSVPYAYAEAANDVKFGDNDDDFFFWESWQDTAGNAVDDSGTFIIGDEDYFLLTSDGTDDSGDSYVLQWNDIDTSDNTVTFTNVATGDDVETTFTSANLLTAAADSTAVGVFWGDSAGEINIGGKDFAFWLRQVSATGDYTMAVDANNDDMLAGFDNSSANDSGADTATQVVNVVVQGGGILQLAGAGVSLPDPTGGDWNITLATLAENVDSSSTQNVSIQFTTSATPELDLSLPATNLSGTWFKQAVNNEDRDEAIDGYGTYFKATDDDEDADSLEIMYPRAQVEALAYVIGGEVQSAAPTSSSSSGAVRVNKVKVGSAVKDSDVEAMGMQTKNLIVVGGPCVNSIAAHLLGDPENCAEGFEAGHAMIKLFPNGNKVALLVAGYGADDTTAAARVLAEYADNKLSGDEVEVTVSGGNKVEVTKK